MIVMPLSMVPISKRADDDIDDAAAAARQADAAKHDDQDHVVDQRRIEDARRHAVDRSRQHHAGERSRSARPAHIAAR